jgi:hypothetical protein
MEKEGSGGHPGKDYGLAGRLAREIERDYVCLAQPLRSLQQIFEIDAEGYMPKPRAKPRGKPKGTCFSMPEMRQYPSA